MRAAALMIALVLSGCAVAVGAPGPGGSGLVRVRGPSYSVHDMGNGYGYLEYDPGAISVAGGGISWVGGGKIGATYGALGARAKQVGIGSEPHMDLTYVPRSDRWSATLTTGWVFQTLYYEDDAVTYSGFTPSVSVAVGIRRRLYLHAGVGHSFGTLKVAPDPADEGMSASAGENRVLGGFSFVFRRTPNIDLTLRFEANAYVSDEVMLGADSGRLSGWGGTFEMILSRF